MADKKISRVTLNGNTLMDIHEDTVAAENLAEGETAHGADGNPVLGTAQFGGDTTDCYKITDDVSTDLADSDYLPFNDVSDSEKPKKKILFSKIVDKLKSTFATITQLNGKQDALTFDDAPTANSNNPVKSSGIKTAIDNITPQSKGSGYCEGTVSGTAITATIDGFVLTKGGIIALKMSVGMPANATLNISNTGAKSIFWENGTAVRYLDPTNIANTWLLTYDGTRYLIVGVNRSAVVTGQSYVADTSGNVALNAFYASNPFQLKYSIPNNVLVWNRYKNGAWYGDVRLVDEESRRLIVNYGENIPANANLNDYRTAGIFNIGSNANAATISNIPIARAGKLIVMYVTGPTYRVQQFIPYNHEGSYGVIYERTWTNDNEANRWTAWVRIVDSRDLNQSVAHTGKNLLPTKRPDYGYIDGATHVTNGISFTFNSDGSITANGTATADAFLNLCSSSYGYMLPKGSYVLTGCPSGGSSSTYSLKLQIELDNGSESEYIDTGSGILFTLNYDGRSGTNKNYYIVIKSGQTVSNLVFKPMVRHAYTDATFEKYIPNGQDVKGVVYVGTCTTAADAKDKVANVDSDFRLKKGVRIAIKFTNTNTYNSTTSSPVTLNVNGTGAKYIWYNTTHSGVGNTGTNITCYGFANKYIYYIYDGSYWVWDSQSEDANNTNYLRNDASSSLTASSAPYLNIKSSTIDMTQSNNGVDTTQYPAYFIQDKGGRDISRLESVVEANGQTRTYLQICNYNSSTSSHFRAGFTMYSNKSQDVWYGLTNPHYFARAIGHGYGTCTTAADQQVKVVTCPRFILTNGAVIHVRFTNTNTFNSQTSTPVQLNVNNTGAKNIWYNTNHSGSGNTGTQTRIYGEANKVFTYMYDGTYWVWLNCGYEADTQDPRVLSFGYGTCDTAAATTAKVVTLANYLLRTGGYVSIRFTYAVPASATMNINSRGARAIYHRNAAIKANIIKAGDIATFVYDGTNYLLVGIDRNDDLSINYGYNNSAGRPNYLTFDDTDVYVTQLYYVVKGDVVVVSMNIKLNVAKTYSGNTKLLHGFVAPLQFVFFESQNKSFYLDTDGNLYVRSTSFTSGQVIWGIHFSYIKS